MKMVKKLREYKAGDFIFAKVKGYPAWPARVQRMNGKKYFVYFYGTGETANLPPNMIFDYAENKDKFLTKTVKRRDFNDGVKQIEYDFANNVSLEQVIGVAPETEDAPNDTINDSTANETVDESMADTTAAEETITEENTTQNDTGIEDSDETGALIIDEGKQGKGRKSTAKIPAKETPKAVKEPKTPRGKAKKDDDESKEQEKKDEEIVSRSGRKIRPKRYIDEHTEENTALPSPAPKKRRGASPVEKKDDKENKDKDKETKDKEKENKDTDDKDKNIKHFNAVTRSDLEDLKEPFTPDSLVSHESPLLNRVYNEIGIKKSKKIFKPPIKNSINNKSQINNLTLLESVEKNVDIRKCCMELDQPKNINVMKETLNTINSKNSITKVSLDGILLSSFNVLNDDETDNMCESVFNSQENPKLSQQSNIVFSRNDSIGSVISLNNIYKDLDNKSSENIHRQEESGFMNCQNIPQYPIDNTDCKYFDDNNNHAIDYKIPTGEDFINLFKGVESLTGPNKFVPMTTKLGDMGLNVNYTDSIKEYDFIDEDTHKEVISKILEMYPVENEIFLKIQKHIKSDLNLF